MPSCHPALPPSLRVSSHRVHAATHLTSHPGPGPAPPGQALAPTPACWLSPYPASGTGWGVRGTVGGEGHGAWWGVGGTGHGGGGTGCQSCCLLGEPQPGKGSFFLPFSLFPPISTLKKKLLRDDLELFAKCAFCCHRKKAITVISVAPLPPPAHF